ncbi:unnamed protein product, partial [Effrenium voratum]
DRWKIALQLFQEMRRGVKPTVVTWNALLAACPWPLTLLLLQEMDLKPDSYTFTAAVSVCETAAQWERAVAIFREAEAEHIADVFSCSAAISACEKAGQWQTALELFCGASMKLQPNLHVHNAMISAFAKGQQWQRAMDHLFGMAARTVEPDVLSFNSALHACRESGQQHAWELFQQMRAASLADVVSYNSAMDVLDQDEGLAVFNEALELGYFSWLRFDTVLDLHDCSVGAARCAVLHWLQKLPPKETRGILITGRGNNSRPTQTSTIQVALLELLRRLRLPARILPNPGRLEVALDLLLALPDAGPAGQWPQVPLQLHQLLGRGRDEDVFRCGAKFPASLEGIWPSLEQAVRGGFALDCTHLPPAAGLRLRGCALEALQKGHLSADVSMLLELPSSGLDLLDAADFLLRAADVAARLASLELWSRLLSQLKATAPGERRSAFARFSDGVFLGALWQDDASEDVEALREGLWSLAQNWQLTPERPTLLEAAQQKLQGDWREVEVALWLFAKYAKRRPAGELRPAVQAAVMILEKLRGASGYEMLLESACELLAAAPCKEALPLLLARPSPAPTPSRTSAPKVLKALRACAACHGVDEGLAQQLQHRALEGEVELVPAAAQLTQDVRSLAQQWARLCAEASPAQLPPRARALVSCMIRPELCQLWWRDCQQLLAYLPPEDQVHYACRVADFASVSGPLLGPACEIWQAVWPRAEGDEDMVAALEQLVQASARSSTVAKQPLLQLAQSLEVHASGWAPQVVSAALGAVEASVAPCGANAWPLTAELVPVYGHVIRCAASISSCQPVPALSLIGALASDPSSALGQELRQQLLGQEPAVRLLMSKAEPGRVTERIAAALGL